MSGPSFFDWVTTVRHKTNGRRIPWLENKANQELTTFAGSVLVLHLPSSGGNGPGHLVVAADGEAAFITETGTCWDLGSLVAAIKEVHTGSDGSIQVFLLRPSSLHINFERDNAQALLSMLNSTNAVDKPVRIQQKEGEDMNLFGRKSTAGTEPVIWFPNGQPPPAGMLVEEFFVRQALDKTGQSVIPAEDLMSYGEASYAHMVGIPENALIVAWGPALIQTPDDNKQRDGTVVLTKDTMLAYWQPGRTNMIHTFQGNHTAVTAAQSSGPYSILLQWEIAEYANNNGKFIVGDAAVNLAARLGRDGHENRRALTWFYALEALVSGHDAGSPHDGLGPSGTKL